MGRNIGRTYNTDWVERVVVWHNTFDDTHSTAKSLCGGQQRLGRPEYGLLPVQT
ncbi:hypothetical protein [Rhodoferax sp.]|uniref:hypothetical protein n=1 Tax=Rhodoferax sp. TaxID=50421 RepID=UPI00374D33D2